MSINNVCFVLISAPSICAYCRFSLISGNHTCVDSENLENLVISIIEAYDQGVIATNTTESADNWNLWSSFFFSATVITTIGR